MDTLTCQRTPRPQWLFYVLLVAATALASPQSLRADTSPLAVSYNFDALVSRDDRALIQAAVLSGDAFFRNSLGVQLQTVRVDVTSSATDAAGQPQTGTANPGHITIYAGSPVWQKTTSYRRAKIVIHELFHVAQFQLSGNVFGPNSLGPDVWLIEGAAEYMGFRGVDDAGVFSFGLARNEQWQGAQTVQVDLAAVDNADGSSYTLGFFAVELLVKTAGLRSVSAYWASGENFTRAFGTTEQAFYESFGIYRKAVFAAPPPSIKFLYRLPAGAVAVPANTTVYAFQRTNVPFQPATTCQCPPQSHLGATPEYSLLLFLPSDSPAGHYTFTVNNPAQPPVQVSFDHTITAVNVTPAVSSLEPPAATAGQEGFLLAVRGNGFGPNASVLWNGSPRPTTNAGDGLLQAGITALDIARAGTAYVSVVNPLATPATSNALPITIESDSTATFSAVSVLNAASFVGGPVSPGEIVTLFGAGLTNQVTFDGVAAVVSFSSATQVNVTVPYGTNGPSTLLKIGRTAAVLPVTASAPGIFAAVPAGSDVLVLYATGGGVLSGDHLPRIQLSVSVLVNGQVAEVLYAGIAPGLVEGANQINVRVPPSAISGPVTILLRVGDAQSAEFRTTLPNP